VNDLNGPLYILDKQTKKLTKYLDFNGVGERPGLFARLTYERNLATGLINVIFDPDYARNGVFYTIHMEDPTIAAPAEPKAGAVPGLAVSGYRTTPAIVTPTLPGATIDRESVVVEWTHRNITNTTFEGTAREVLRIQLPSPIHPLGEMTFNPTARRGDADWRVMYIGSGDAGTGEQRDIRRLNPQRLDNLAGKILRIVPDLREHTATSTVSENGRYRSRATLRFRRGAQGDLGRGFAQSASSDLGRGPGSTRSAAPVRVQHRPGLVGDDGDCQEGGELRLPVA
jgi:hypothetical protein